MMYVNEDKDELDVPEMRLIWSQFLEDERAQSAVEQSFVVVSWCVTYVIKKNRIRGHGSKSLKYKQKQ